MSADQPQTPKRRRPDVKRPTLIEEESQIESSGMFTQSLRMEHSHLFTPEGYVETSTTPRGRPPPAIFDSLANLGKNRTTIRRGHHEAALNYRANSAKVPGQGSNHLKGGAHHRIFANPRAGIVSEKSTTPREQPPMTDPLRARLSWRHPPARAQRNRAVAADWTIHTPAETPNRSTTPFGSPPVTDVVIDNIPTGAPGDEVLARSAQHDVSQVSEVARFAMQNRHAKMLAGTLAIQDGDHDAARRQIDSIDCEPAARLQPPSSLAETPGKARSWENSKMAKFLERTASTKSGPFGTPMRSPQPRDRPFRTTIYSQPPKAEHIRQSEELAAEQRRVHGAGRASPSVKPDSRNPSPSVLASVEKRHGSNTPKILSTEHSILMQNDLSRAEAAWGGIKERYRANVLKGTTTSLGIAQTLHDDKHQLPRPGVKKHRTVKRFSLTREVIPVSTTDPDTKSVLPLPELLEKNFDKIVALAKQAAELSLKGGEMDMKLHPDLEDVFRAPWPKGPHDLSSIRIPVKRELLAERIGAEVPSSELPTRSTARKAPATSAMAIEARLTGKIPSNTVDAATILARVPVGLAQLHSATPPLEDIVGHYTTANGYGSGWGFLLARKAQDNTHLVRLQVETVPLGDAWLKARWDDSVKPGVVKQQK